MRNGFKVKKAAQVAAYFALAEGGAINVLKLIKLIYLADREFMTRYDCPILNDRFVSMDHGPVNSMTLNYVNGCEDRRADWDAYVTDRDGNQIGLARGDLRVEDLGELSDAEIEVLTDVAAKFKGWSGYQVRDYTHVHCPEWENPNGSSNPIPVERVLKFLGKDNPSQLAEHIEAERQLDTVLLAAE